VFHNVTPDSGLIFYHIVAGCIAWTSTFGIQTFILLEKIKKKFLYHWAKL